MMSRTNEVRNYKLVDKCRLLMKTLKHSACAASHRKCFCLFPIIKKMGAMVLLVLFSVMPTHGQSNSKLVSNDQLDLSELTVGQTATGTLAAGESELFQFTITAPVWHGTCATPTGMSVQPDTTDLSVPGTYSLVLSNTTSSVTSYKLRIYNYTNAIASIESHITNTMANHDVPGMAFTLVDGPNVIMVEGFGFAHVKKEIPVTGDTIFNIGSVSKMFTTLATMQLVDDGLLDLDAPITNNLPDLVLRERFSNNAPMTARQMLAHLSGLPGDYFNGADSLWPITTSNVNRVLGTITNDYPSMPVAFTPIYCNSGWSVLEKLIENLGGASFHDYTATHIFQPLNMTRTSTRRNAVAEGTNAAIPYSEGIAQPYEYLSIEGTGGISSSANDLARFLCMLLGEGKGTNGVRVLSAEAIQAIFQPQANDAAFVLQRFFYPGLGWDFVCNEQLAFAGRYAIKAGDVTYEHAGIAVLPDAGIGVSVQMNGSGIYQNPLLDQCLRYATRDKLGEYGSTNTVTPVFSPVTSWSTDALEAVTGHYAGMNAVSMISDDTTNGTLTLMVDVQSDTSGTFTNLVPRANGWFSSPTSQVFELTFTNVLDQTLLLTRQVTPTSINETFFAQHFEPVALSGTWSNRVATWIPVNIPPGDYYAIQGLDTCEMKIHENIFYIYDDMAMQPVNDNLAFSPFYGYRVPTTLQIDPLDNRFMLYGDIRLQRLDEQPILMQGTSTNGIINGDEPQFFRIPVSTGDTFIIDLDTTNHLQTVIYQDDIAQGIASPAHAIQITSPADGEILLNVQRNGPKPGDFRLTIHTNALPFFAEVPPEDWPAEMTARSNLFPDTDFGYVFVHENPTNQTGNVLKIAVARMNAPAHDAQPLLFCNGGPENSSILCVYQNYMKGFTNDYDVHLIDQRGINFSQPMLSPREGETLEEIQYRLTMLEGADLSAINTESSSRDLEDIAAALDLSDANLLGQSYGTLLAQTLMRREPAWLRAVVLDGPIAPNIPPLEGGGPVMQEAVDSLCSDAATSVWYQELNDKFYALAMCLQTNPYTLILQDWTNNIDDSAFFDAVSSQLMSSDLGTRERLPNIIWRAWQGEKAALADLYTGNHFDTNTTMHNVISELMGQLVIRHDFLPFNTLEGVSNACSNLREPLRSYAIAYNSKIINDAAALNDYGQTNSNFTLPVTSNIPTLVISGNYDTQISTNWAVEVDSRLPNSFLVLIPTVGHGVLAGGECPQQIVRDFLADPSQMPDTSCLAHMVLDCPTPLPNNITLLAFGQPVIEEYPLAESASWNQFNAVSGVVYTITQTGEALLQALNENGQSIGKGYDSTLTWESMYDGLHYINAINPVPGSNTLTLDLPLLFRNMHVQPPDITLTWQSLTNTTVDLCSLSDLVDTNSVTILQTNLTAAGWFSTAITPALTNQPATFYYLKEH
jgi:CubicO group peptidase (beta-lactamase class C family)/pimeloyl-ACP methyl ester carboxylesterase